MDTETWLKKLNKRVVFGSLIFAVVGLAFLFYIIDFSLIGFLWFWVGAFAGGALAHFLFPAVVRQRLILSVGFVFLVGLGFSFIIGGLLPFEQSQNLLIGSVVGWAFGSGRLLWPFQRRNPETPDRSSSSNSVILGYTALFAVGLFIGLVLSGVLL